MRKKRSNLKWRVNFDPRLPITLTLYVDNSDLSRQMIASVRRVANYLGVEVELKPVGPDAPTLVPAIFVQGKYFFSYATDYSEKALISFISQARRKQQELMREWVKQHSGHPVVAPRPLYDTDGRKYPNRFRLLMPSQYDLGFEQYQTDEIGWEVNRYTIEGLRDLGVDVMLFADAGVGEFIIYTGTKTKEE